MLDELFSLMVREQSGVLCLGVSAQQRQGQKPIKVQLGKGGLPAHLQPPGSANATPATSTGGMAMPRAIGLCPQLQMLQDGSAPAER